MNKIPLLNEQKKKLWQLWVDYSAEHEYHRTEQIKTYCSASNCDIISAIEYIIDKLNNHCCIIESFSEKRIYTEIDYINYVLTPMVFHIYDNLGINKLGVCDKIEKIVRDKGSYNATDYLNTDCYVSVIDEISTSIVKNDVVILKELLKIEQEKIDIENEQLFDLDNIPLLKKQEDAVFKIWSDSWNETLLNRINIVKDYCKANDCEIISAVDYLIQRLSYSCFLLTFDNYTWYLSVFELSDFVISTVETATTYGLSFTNEGVGLMDKAVETFNKTGEYEVSEMESCYIHIISKGVVNNEIELLKKYKETIKARNATTIKAEPAQSPTISLYKDLDGYIDRVSEADFDYIIHNRTLPNKADKARWIGTKADAGRFIDHFKWQNKEFNDCFYFKNEVKFKTGNKDKTGTTSDISVILNKHSK